MNVEVPYIEIELPDYREITEDGHRMLLEFTVKHNGKWRVHKNDQDIISPSDFHADRVDKPEKMDLYTGDIYSKIDGKYIRTEPGKAMRYIYLSLQACKEDLIKNRLQQKDRFSYMNSYKLGSSIK